MKTWPVSFGKIVFIPVFDEKITVELQSEVHKNDAIQNINVISLRTLSEDSL